MVAEGYMVKYNHIQYKKKESKMKIKYNVLVKNLKFPQIFRHIYIPSDHRPKQFLYNPFQTCGS